VTSSVREELEQFWNCVDLQAQLTKDPHYALKRLIDRFQSFSEDERLEAERVVAGWTLSDQPRKRFDAVALVDRLRIRQALPMLRELADRFEHSVEPRGPYDWAWINRVIGRLTAGTPPQGE